jgi:hypothetical protein
MRLPVRTRERQTGQERIAVDNDAEQLRALGYSSGFDRTLTKWQNFSLGFTYLSPQPVGESSHFSCRP